ncbi:MAG: phosphoribosylglycinamide formyltransferase [Clostridia bacterium]|nr:phosphoribosylglycinamide formyltransferase [Clostridia bacterium]
MKKMKTAVFVSGGGTNLQALIDACKSGIIVSAEITCVISNKDDIYALTRAKEAGIETCVIKDNFEDSVLSFLQEKGVELIVLAGFLSIVGKKLIQAFPNKIINIHPSLIPAFCGKGHYGLHVHEKVIAYGAKLTGATVHFVSEEVDGGVILLQKSVAVLPTDTPKVLQKRVMQEAEWIILPEAVELVSSGRVEVNGRTAIIH